MNISVVTYFTPFKENKGGISALIYQLLKYRPVDINIQLFSFNANNLSNDEIDDVSRSLSLDIEIIPLPSWIRRLQKTSLYGKMDLFAPKPLQCYVNVPDWVLSKINVFADIVWIYPYFSYCLAKKLPKKKFVITGCDSNHMLYSRWIKEVESTSSFMSLCALKKRCERSAKIEKEISNLPNATIHFVGKNDRDFYSNHTGRSNCFYAVHPHYTVADKTINFSDDKIRILIAGANDMYMQRGGCELINELTAQSYLLYDKIEISFLGRNWEKERDLLAKADYDVKIIGWVDDYINEIIKYDIQLTPITLGTGTKGKVLDAMANGLLCIGTDYAMENICEDSQGGIVYVDVCDVTQSLLDIYENRKTYEKIATIGRDRIRKEHSPETAAIVFYNHLNQL